MYAIYADGRLLYSPNLSEEGYFVESPTVDFELNKTGNLKFILPPQNPLYNSITKLKSIITVQQDGEEIFCGRILRDEKDFYNEKDVYCEGELSFLLDSVTRPYAFKGDIPDLLKKFLDNHNSQVEPEKQFLLGNITVTDPNNYINRWNSNYSSTWDEINDKLINLCGGYISVRKAEGKRYLDYNAEPGKINGQTIAFGENILDITEYITAEDVFTVLIPLGAATEGDDGETGEKLTIKTVNGGKDYIENATGISLFGRIWRTAEWEDVTLPENLLKKGREYLENGIEMAVSLTLKAVDLHLLNVDVERLKLGDYNRVISLPHGIDNYFLCSKISLDLEDPENNEYTFGFTFKTLTEKQTAETKNAYGVAVVANQTANKANTTAEKALNQGGVEAITNLELDQILI